MSDTEETQATPGASSAIENPHPLDDLIASIRAAVAVDASPDVRANGAAACRSLLAALETQAGQPLTMTRQPASSSAPRSPIAVLLAQLRLMPRDKVGDLLTQLVTSPKSPLDGILAQFAAMPREQLVDLINRQLRALAPAGAPLRSPAGPRFHLISIPQLPRYGRAP